MADEVTDAPQDVPQTNVPSKPSANRRSVASIVQVAFLVVFGGLGYFGIWALNLFDVLGEVSTALTTAMLFGGLIVGVIIGGILGAKAKQAILR